MLSVSRRRSLASCVIMSCLVLGLATAAWADEPPLPMPGPTSAPVSAGSPTQDLAGFLLNLGASLWVAWPV